MAEEFSTEGMLDMYLFENQQLLERLQEIVLEQKDEECFDEDSINEIFRTLAFQITEELDQRLKNFIAAEKKRGRKISQKEFVIGLIEQALAAYEAQNPPEKTSEE